MKHFLLLVLLVMSSVSYAQPDENPVNATLVSHTTLPGNEDGNDVWGYVDTAGVEYAIIGGASNTHIYSLEDPATPILRISIPGTTTIWRDMKSWEDHIYVTTDNSNNNPNFDGLIIIDMSAAPEDITFSFIRPTYTFAGEEEQLGSCHNIYIDEDGFAYLAGCNVGEGGIIILDLKPDKDNPVYVGNVDSRYSHDVYVRDSLMYTSDIFAGIFSIYDVRDRADPQFIVGDQTSFDFTHNAWLSDDGNYLFTTDERANAYVDAFDISDYNDVEKIDRYRPIDTEGQDVIPHNTHYYNGYLVTSWYTDGLKVIDAHRPDNLIEVAKYDTWDGPSGGFFGCWGAYPFLPSGLMLASDINSGLYVIDVDFKRAAYLEGRVTDATTGSPIVNVSVVISDIDPNRNMSDPTGEYKTGTVSEGTFEVLFNHPNYRPATGIATLVSGEVTMLDVELVQEVLNVKVQDINGDPIPGASVYIANDAIGMMNQIMTDDTGRGSIGLRDNESYLVQAASWGYKGTEIESYFVGENPDELVITLERGFEDDFFVDLGWTIEGTASAGTWIREIPNITTIQGSIINPDTDSPNDLGEFAFVTGNAPGVGWTEDDIDNGFTLLTSPSMDFTDADAADISFETWYVIGGSGTPDDSLIVSIDNGIEEVRLHVEADVSNEWTLQEFNITPAFIAFTDEMRIKVRASDEGEGNIVEAGFDALEVTLDIADNVIEIDQDWQLTAAPNPCSDQLHIEVSEYSDDTRITVVDMLGQTIYEQDASRDLSIKTSDWTPGAYFVQLRSADRLSPVQKVIKQ